MSSSNSHSSIFSTSSISNPCEIEDERAESAFEASHSGHMHDINAADEAYLDEPIADEGWLQEYH